MKLEMSKNKTNILDIMTAYREGYEIERQSADGYWDLYTGSEFDTDRKYRKAKRYIISEFSEKYLSPIWKALTSNRSQNIQITIIFIFMATVIILAD